MSQIHLAFVAVFLVSFCQAQIDFQPTPLAPPPPTRGSGAPATVAPPAPKTEAPVAPTPVVPDSAPKVSAVTAAVTKKLRCISGGNDCCTTSNRCQEGEGDCDSDAECQDGLFCGRDNCKIQDFKDIPGRDKFSGSDDCCQSIKI